MRYAHAVLASAMLLLPSLPLFAQDKKPPDRATYKVEFDLRDGGQAAAGAGRHYSMILEGEARGTFRVGNRVPVATQSQNADNAAPASTQFQYLDVGVTISCSVREAEAGKLGMRANFDISSVLPRDLSVDTPAAAGPAIGQLKIEVETLVSPGKPTVVASVDDPVTKRKFDVETTVSRVN
ncbi:MAG: hypothetical protein ACLQVN_21265 [Bryobacteraceae bacterium]